MNRLLIILCAAILCGGCVSKSKVYTWLDKNPKEAARYASVHFPPKVVKGETKVVKVVDSVDRIVTVVDSIPCPDGSKVAAEKEIQYIVQKEYLERVDTTTNVAEVEKERLRANEAEKRASIAEGLVEVEKERTAQSEQKAKNRLWWIIGLGVFAALELAFIIRRIF